MKIVQEVKLPQSVYVSCGESMFPLEATILFAHDVGKYQASLRHTSGHLRDMFLYKDTRHMSIWDLASTYYDYQCADPRDRVFSLLALLTKGPSGEIRPDYTKTALQVLLQLLDQQVRDVKHEYNQRFAMTETSNIIGGFHLGTLAVEMADLLRSREATHAASSPQSQEVVFDHQSQRRIILEAKWSCAVWEDEAGNMVTSLLRESTPDTRIRGHDFQYVQQQTEGTAVKIHNPLGKVVALADKNVKAGDRFLFFSNEGPSAYPSYGLCPPFAGLVVRWMEPDIHIIVGQVVIDYGIRPCESPCSCVADTGKRRHGFEPEDWWVYMSPEDLLLFVAQDMRSEVSSPRHAVGPAMELTVRREETAKRLITSVTTDAVSSYAIRRRESVGLVFKWDHRFPNYTRLDPGKFTVQHWRSKRDDLMFIEAFDSEPARRLRFSELFGVDVDSTELDDILRG